MTEDSANESAKPASGPGRTPTIFVTDAAAESSRIADTLRAAGYSVVDVPLSMLVSRAQAQRPHVVLVDIDANQALDEVGRLRRQPGAGAIDFVYFGTGTGIIRSADDAMTHEGSAFFMRPVDIGALVRRIEALTGGPVHRPDVRPSTPPPSIPRRHGSVPPVSGTKSDGSGERSDRGSSPSLPAPGLRTPGPPLPMSSPSLADLVEPPRSFATFGTVSNELQQLLADAEMRAEVMPHPDAPLPSPEEELESVLPADVLASLDEPLEGDDDEEHHELRLGTGVGTGAGTGPGDHERTGAHAKGTTSGGSSFKQTTATGGRPISSHPAPHTHERRTTRQREVPSWESNTRETHDHPETARQEAPTDAGRQREPGRRTSDPVPSSRRAAVRVTGSDPPLHKPAQVTHAATLPTPLPPSVRPKRDGVAIGAVDSTKSASPSVERVALVNVTDVPSMKLASLTSAPPTVPDERRPPASDGSRATPENVGLVVTDAVSARRFFGDAIARRLTGVLCFEHDGVVRRIVIRDGDLVTAASGAEQESLVAFLSSRGELPRDEVERLANKIPPYGRHAGAALVAHGWLGQDQLWSVLRAHAEWIATATLCVSGGTARLEVEPPGRLRSEPSVFAATTGAEIFVELVRRAISPSEALAALGGEGSRIGDGPMQSLFGECALSPADVELISRARGGTVGDLLARSSDAEIASVVHALALLGVLDVLEALPVIEARPSAPRDATDLEAAALDDEAIRARVRARLELVDEGDYFSVLGVSRDATSYEVRRAFVELRRAFEPTRILSPRLIDLTDDVRKIVVVLEEAYEILRDGARRERYRRAIDARP